MHKTHSHCTRWLRGFATGFQDEAENMGENMGEDSDTLGIATAFQKPGDTLQSVTFPLNRHVSAMSPIRN